MMTESSPGELQAFLTTEEVLGYLKVTPRTIYRLIRAGELPAVRIGRQWRFRRADLDEWLDRQRTTFA
jgi:excisionase family DNA binding protein